MMSVKEGEHINIQADLLKLMIFLAYKNTLNERLHYFRARIIKFLDNFKVSKDFMADFEQFATIIEGDLFKDHTDFKTISWKLYSALYHG